MARAPYRKLGICSVCGDQFTANSTTHKYCSLRCAFSNKFERKQSGCWEWTHCKLADGYGTFNHAGRTFRGHRVSYELHKGAIAKGLFVCHSCDNPSCVNPDHLFLGTNLENIQDMVKKGRSYDRRGIKNPKAKINEQVVKFVRHSDKSAYAIARAYKVDASTIEAIRRGETWSHVE